VPPEIAREISKRFASFRSPIAISAWCGPRGIRARNKASVERVLAEIAAHDSAAMISRDAAPRVVAGDETKSASAKHGTHHRDRHWLRELNDRV